MSGSFNKSVATNVRINKKPRSFVLRQPLKNVLELEDNRSYYYEVQEHFGVPWCILVENSKGYLGVYLRCELLQNEKKWSIDVEAEIHILSQNEKSASEDFKFCFENQEARGRKIMTWEKLEEEYLVNEDSAVEIRVKILKMSGIDEYLRKFDDEECSDAALVVDGKKFYIAKLYLASQSSYFKSMFLGKFNESAKSEIELTGIEAYNLQKYLEMLYGENALDDETVDGILHLADMYDTRTLIEKCEEYLLEVSKKTLKDKLEMSVRYNLTELKEKCMSEIKTLGDIRSVLPACIEEMDHSLMASLFKKTLDLK